MTRWVALNLGQCISLQQLPALRTPILLTADRAAFPDPPPGKAQFDVEDVLTAVAEQVTKGVDGIYDKRRPKEERYWDIVVRDDPARPAPLNIHIPRWENANASWPLRPYVQAPESGLMTSGIAPGTVVVPVHPSQVGHRFQRGECVLRALRIGDLDTEHCDPEADRTPQDRLDQLYPFPLPLCSCPAASTSAEILAKHHLIVCVAERGLG